MKKLIIELLKRFFDKIITDWIDKLVQQSNSKLSESQIRTFVESTLNTIIDVVETGDYTRADQYLIDSYQLFSTANLNMLEISQFFTNGRYAILTYIEKDQIVESYFDTAQTLNI